MIELLCCCTLFAAFLVVALKMDKLAKSSRDLAERYFFMEEANRRMERAHNINADKVDAMMSHFTLPPVTEPLPLPPSDHEETRPETGPMKRRRSKRPV